MSDFVLVHGAWHGGWCWKRVTRLLRAAGHEVFTPTLTGLGEREHLMGPEVGLDTHIRDVLGVLEYEDLRDVILVGHSYAGMVISGVAEKAAERISHLVYLDAFVPEDGRSLVDYQPPEMLETFTRRTREEGDGYRLPLVFSPEELGVTDPSDLAWVRPRIGPHPFKTKTDAISLADPNAARIPRIYIRCTAPASGPFAQFAERVQVDGSWGYHELATGHDAMITAPEEVADLLLQFAGPPTAGHGAVTSLQGPVVMMSGELQLRIPLAAGGSQLIKVTRDIGRVEDDCLVVAIPDRFAEKLGIRQGSIVHVDDSEGGFNIWPVDTQAV